MNKYYWFILIMLSVFYPGPSQIIEPVKWSFRSSELGNNEFELFFSADIDKGWYMYGRNIADDGPIATSIDFIKTSEYTLEGDIQDLSKPKIKYDPTFEMNLELFSNHVEFKQRVKLLVKKTVTIQGIIEFMSCDNEKCLPPKDIDFEFILKNSLTDKSKPNDPSVSADDKDQSKKPGKKVEVKVQASSSEIIADSMTSAPDSLFSPSQNAIISQDILSDSSSKEDETSTRSLWSFFFFALSLGFVGIFTPCVYPMIPITVNFFLAGKKSKLHAKTRAVFYGFSIVFIYTFIGILVTLIFGANAIRSISQHWITNLLFFLLFIVFATSFFGMFEIMLPASLSNRADKGADRGGYIGTFFMALTLVLVSFSCTAPFVGGILVEAATGQQILKPMIGMLGFSSAFGIVFTLLALFPSLLSKLPKSGGWLNSVKVVIAFLIIAFGIKYLIVPLEALGWGIPRELFIFLWLVIFVLMGLYLWGKIRFAHDSKVTHVSIPRLFFILISFSIALYLIPGLLGQPIKVLSGFLPTGSIYETNKLQSGENTDSSLQGNEDSICEEPKYNNLFSLPYGLKGYYDYKQGMECASELKKPVLLYFKGHACTNCKVMEKNVWSDSQVRQRLRNDFVLIVLYVDERAKLPESEWITSIYDGRIKNTIGKKNSDFQITKYNVNSQPYFILLDHRGNMLNAPIGYTSDINKYIRFLDEGMSYYTNNK